MAFIIEGRRERCRIALNEDKVTEEREVRDLDGTAHTTLFNLPTTSPSSISRASSLCPTSSKASVASWPPTSSNTSSPPLHPQ